MPMTMGEKILAAAAGKDTVRPGEIHTLQPDWLMSNDGTTHLTIDMYETEVENPRLHDPDKLVFVIDHNSPADSAKTAEAHLKMRGFAKENGITFYEGQGVCHQLMLENHVRSGEVILGADSHTCSYGALGAFGTGVGCTDFLYAMVTGTTWMLVPPTLRFELSGTLPPGVYARDLMLTIIGDIGADGATYKIMEFAGDGLHGLSIDERIVLANLAVEAGAKTALMPVDDKTRRYLKEHGRDVKAAYESDEDAVFEAVYKYDLSTIKPVVARPDRVDDVVPAQDVQGVAIQQAFVGSCNNGRLEDLQVAADVLKNRTVHPAVRFIISPASNAVYQEALRQGVIQTLTEAGAMVVNSNCSVCWGSCQGVIGKDEVLVSTGTRNFKGRAGHPESKIYLASAATAAASAVKGEITTADRL